jgi:gamma-glutamyltranspeptidase/glutathione hydrolase
MRSGDLKRYRVIDRDPTQVGYRGRQVYGMAPPSSGGSTVGEALNILEGVDLRALPRPQALHNYLEASALAYADRGAYVGDPGKVDVPLKALLSQGYADERFCQIDQSDAATKPVAAGSPDGHYDRNCDGIPESRPSGGDQEGLSTTHLVTSDRWGNVVSYTLTIEQIGGSGIVVPRSGFLLNNELTDFNFEETVPGDPNLPAAGKRPRSSMAPTIVVDNGRATLALGSPGGATIITTVLQMLINKIDFKMTLPQALAAPRASPRNGATVPAESGFDTSGLTSRGHTFSAAPGNQLGAAVGLAFRRNGRIVAAAEPVRRGGGSAGVVRPR